MPIVFPARPELRPTPDRVRETVFNWLQPVIGGARCLDLFAGSGALGIEALSRGAEACTFVDVARPAGAAVRENLRRTGLSDRATVVVRDVGAYLRRRASDEPPVDLVFVDPPYEIAGPALDRVFEALDAGWLAEGDWTVVVTRGHKGSLPAVPVHWAARRQLRYGDSLVILYRP